MRNLQSLTANPCVTKLGNWQEDKVYLQQQKDEYLERKSKGLLASSLLAKGLELCNQSMTLGSSLVVGVPLEIVSAGGPERKLAVDFPLNWPHPESPQIAGQTTSAELRKSQGPAASEIEFPLTVTASTSANTTVDRPVARTSFTFSRVEELECVLGDEFPQLCFGDKVYIEASSLLSLAPHHQAGASVAGNIPFYVSSSRAFTDRTNGSNLQKTFLTPKKDYNSVWQVQLADPEYRLEAIGKPVQGDVRVLLIHCATNSALYTNPAHVVRNFFAVESEVSCGTVIDQNTRAELDFNHWYICN